VSGSMTAGLVTSRLLGMPERDESLTEGVSP
jgi:hypothetical protein